MNHPGIMEERCSKRNLAHDRFDRFFDRDGPLVVHSVKMRPSNRQNQHVVFSVHAFQLELIQEGQDVTGSRMCPRSGREVMKNLDLVVLAGEFSHRELECDVSTT